MQYKQYTTTDKEEVNRMGKTGGCDPAGGGHRPCIPRNASNNEDGPATCNNWSHQNSLIRRVGVRREVSSGVTVASKRHLPKFFFLLLFFLWAVAWRVDWSDWGSRVGMPPVVFLCDLQFYFFVTGEGDMGGG